MTTKYVDAPPRHRQWRGQGTLRLGAKMYLRTQQPKLQSLKRKIGAKARKKQKQNICHWYFFNNN